MIYLDNNATTPLAPQVVDAMLPMLREHFGNPSSGHVVGQRAAYAVSSARLQVAQSIAAKPSEIVFTSGGSESNNLVIRGVLESSDQKKHLITCTTEHDAVYRPIEHCTRHGHEVTFVPVNSEGHIDVDALRGAIRQDTALISVMLANNETGVITPIAEISEICREHELLLHTDAVQAMGKLPIDVGTLGVDLLSLSAHKFHGPKGVGALFVREGVTLATQALGGHQESGKRGGTENVAGIVGMGVAAELANQHLDEYDSVVRSLREDFEQGLLSHYPTAKVVGRSSQRLANTSTVIFPGIMAQDLLISLSEIGICASGGAACHSGSVVASRVLAAMGFASGEAQSAVRFSLSRYNTNEEISATLQALPQCLAKLESFSTTVFR